MRSVCNLYGAKSLTNFEEGILSTKVIRTPLLMILGLAAFSTLHAQEIVHATAGALADSRSKDSLSIQGPDQSVKVLRINQSSLVHVDFDKSLQAKTESLDKLANTKTNVIVYYYGYSPETAIAVKDLGNRVQYLNGKITRSDKGQHTITIRAEDGKDHICYVDADTTMETSSGVASGAKDFPRKGQSISVVCTEDAGKEDAQLIVMLL
jgi:hypothetical protein